MKIHQVKWTKNGTLIRVPLLNKKGKQVGILFLTP